MALKTIGLHITKTGKRYQLQYDASGKFAQAVLIPTGAGPGHLVLAFRAKTEKEAVKMLLDELEKGGY